jgi:hypothetical protein
MTTFSFTLSDTDRTKLINALSGLKTQLDLRKELWARLPADKCKAWVTSDKDDVMSLAWDIYKYLDNNFFYRKGEVENG